MDKEKIVGNENNDKSLSDEMHRMDVISEMMDRKRKRRSFFAILFLSSIVLLFLGVFCLTQTDAVSAFFMQDKYYSNSAKERIYVFTKFLGGGFTLASLVIFSYLYMIGFDLKRFHENPKAQSFAIEGNEEWVLIRKLLKSIDKSIAQGRLENSLSSEERDLIINKLSETVESQLNESLLLKIQEKYGSAIHDDVLSNLASASLNSTVDRLKDYSENLQKKANVNLIWGIGATLTAIMILGFVLMNAHPPEKSTQILITFFYTSRFMLVLLVQGVAIFFLNLYKITLNNSLYINNEITNYEARRDSLVLAIKAGSAKAIEPILLSLALTERNFTLKKGETSIFAKNDNSNTELIDPSNVIREMLSKFVAVKD